jgi:hypothetical protein
VLLDHLVLVLLEVQVLQHQITTRVEVAVQVPWEPMPLLLIQVMVEPGKIIVLISGQM